MLLCEELLEDYFILYFNIRYIEYSIRSLLVIILL